VEEALSEALWQIAPDSPLNRRPAKTAIDIYHAMFAAFTMPYVTLAVSAVRTNAS
jgi:hypothetical protein